MSELEYCDKMDTCKFFEYLAKASGKLIPFWQMNFCSDPEKTVGCARKRRFKETGEVPPDNLAPTGKLI